MKLIRPVRGEVGRRFWQALTLFSLSVCALTGERLWARQGAVHGRRPSLLPAAVSDNGQPALPAQQAAEIPLASDWVLARLKVSESSQELCDLLTHLRPSEAVDQTYSITDVLERTRFKSLRACLVTALAAEPTPAAQSWLLDLANDPEPSVHTVALRALAKREEGIAHATVVDAAYSLDPAVRVAAVNALLNAERSEAFDVAKALLPTLDDPATLADLIDALGASRDPRALPVLQDLIANAGHVPHLRAIAAVGALGVSAGASIVEPYLELGSAEEFSEAARALSALSAASAERDLKALLHARNAQRRTLALRTLTELDTPGLRPILLEAAEGDDPELVSLALLRLSDAKDPSLFSLFARAARHGTVGVRHVALRALLTLGTPKAYGELRGLAAGSGAIAEMAVNAMMQVPELRDEARALRIADLQSSSANKRLNALSILTLDTSEAGRAALVDYLSKSPAATKNWQFVLNALPLSDLQKLVPKAGEEDPSSRQEFFAALAARGDPKSLDLLRSAVRDQDETTRRSAIQGLVNLGAEGSDDLLRGLVKSTSSDDRRLAAELLAARPGAATNTALESLVADPDAEVATLSIAALKDRAPEAAARLTERAFRSGSAENRQVLLGTLSGWNRELALPIIESGLRDPDSSTASSAISALAEFEGPDVARLLYSVVVDTGRPGEVRSAAAAALEALGGPLVRSNQALIESLLAPDQLDASFGQYRVRSSMVVQ